MASAAAVVALSSTVEGYHGINTTSLLKVFIGAGVAVGLLCATAQGQPDPLISGNNVRPWDPNGAIATTKFPTPGSTVDFIPDGTKIDSNGGHGLLVLGNKVYYGAREH